MQPIATRTSSVWESYSRWYRRNRAIASLALLLMCIATLGSLGISSRWWRAEQLVAAEITARPMADTQRTQADNETTRAHQQETAAQAAVKHSQTPAKRANDYLYAARINLAKVAWDAGRTRECIKQLDATKQQEDRRGPEWHYLNRLTQSELFHLSIGERIWSNSLAYSHDGSYLAAASHGQVKVWSVSERQQLQHFAVAGNAHAIIFRPDNSEVIAADGVGNLGYISTIKAWNLETRTRRVIAKFPGSVADFCFNPDGTLLAAAIARPMILVLGPPNMSPDGRGDSIGEVAIFRIQDGKKLHTIPFEAPQLKAVAENEENAHSAISRQRAELAKVLPKYLTYSHDGKQLAVVSASGEVTLLDARSGTKRLTFQSDGGRVAFSSDDALISSAGTTWDVKQGKTLIRRAAAQPWTACVGTRAASSDNRIVTIFDANTHRTLATIKGQHMYSYPLALSPDGYSVAVGDNDQVRVWSGNGNQDALRLPFPNASESVPTVAGTPAPANAVSIVNTTISPGGRHIATLDRSNTVRIWDRLSGRLLKSWKGANGRCLFFQFHRQGTQLAAAFSDDGLLIWDIENGQEVRRIATPASKASLSNDATMLAVLTEKEGDKVVNLYSMATGKVVRTIDPQWYRMYAMAIHPNGKTLALCGQRTRGATRPKPNAEVSSLVSLALYDTSSGQVIQEHDELPDRVSDMNFSPSGKLLAIALRESAHLLDSTTLKSRGLLSGKTSEVLIGPHDRRAFSVGDRVVRIYDIESQQEVLQLPRCTHGLSLDPNASLLAVAGEDVTGSQSTLVFDLRKLADNHQTERNATALLRHFVAQQLPPDEMRKRVQASPTVNEKTRTLALELLKK